jgi:NADPH-dependent ferric siderophore reductase
MPHLDVLTAHAEPGAALCAWAAERGLIGVDRAYLAGHARTVQRLRDLLRRAGLPRGSITGKAYWATGRAGL